MRNMKGAWFGLAGLLSNQARALGPTGDVGDSSGAIGGFILFIGFVLLIYALVFIVKLMTGGRDLGPDKITTADFDDFSRPSDDPNFRFPDSGLRRK